ncbi:MAG: hypothetical protein ACJ8C4_13820 [Gemmataceae bacterium]
MDVESVPSTEPGTRRQKPYFAVLICGLATSAATLAGVYWLGKNTDDFHIMGWYADYVIPAGAIIVGVAAASGYGIASWVSGTRISRSLLFAVLIIQAGAYVTAEYVEYRDVMDGLTQRGLIIGPQQPSFAQYYDFKARSFAWKDKGPGNKPGTPLGGWGYVFVLLGAAGFILSGLIAPLALYSVPYCNRCQRYMKTTLLGVVPASVPVKKIGKKDQEAQDAYAREQQQAAANAEQVIARLRTFIGEGRADEVKKELRAAGAVKANEKLPSRVRTKLIWCKTCQEGRIAMALASGQGKQQKVTTLTEDAVPAAFVGRILEPQLDAGAASNCAPDQ